MADNLVSKFTVNSQGTDINIKIKDTDARNLIAQEISDRNSAITTITKNLNKEITTITNNLNKEINDRENADNAIRESLKKLDVYTTPEMFGAIGDGVTNDYDAITNAINSGLPVIFAAKSYKINTGITITNDSVVIIGTCDWGDKKTTIISGDTNASVISIKGTSSRRIERCNISNINFTYENAADQSAVSIEYANHTYINKCSALNAKNGFRVYGTVRTLLDNCITLPPDGYTGEAIGYVLGDDNDSFDGFSGANASLYLKQCLAVGYDNVNYFGYLISRATSDVFMTDCEVSKCNVGLYIKSENTLSNTSKNNINIDHFVCDPYKQFGIYVQNQSFGSIRIVNSYFAPNTEVSDATAGILFENSRGCFSVEGNQFIGSWIPVNNTVAHRAMALSGATGVYCANNMIKDIPLPVALYGDSSFCTFEDNILEDIVRKSQTDTYLLEGTDINHIKINSIITGAAGAFKGSPVNMVSTNIKYVEINNTNINRFIFTQTTNNIMKFGNVKYDDIGLVESHPLILVTGIMPV